MYCDVSDVRRRTPSITNIDVQDGVVEDYILEGQSVIDSYLSTIYSVPFLTVPATIKRICADIAAYFMMRDFPDKTFELDLERLEKTYLRELTDIVDGKTAVPGIDPLPTATTGAFVYKIENEGTRWDDYDANVG